MIFWNICVPKFYKMRNKDYLLVLVVIIIPSVYAKFIIFKLLTKDLIKNGVHVPHSLAQ